MRPWFFVALFIYACHDRHVIGKIKHKGLKALYTSNSSKGVNPKHAYKLQEILTVLDAATKIKDCAAPGFDLHPLKGNREGEWAITVRANWRVTFIFVDGEATDLNYEDYH